MSPPFAFSDVTMSVFPLRAGLPSLENFCRNYLNQAPHLTQFRPFVPFVYLVILDYGRMSLEAANMGWVSQREVAFGVPLRWLVPGEDGPVFHDWAFTSPFIFVDNELSMSTGREVYGWPKLLARLDPSVSEWVRNPHGARRVFQVSTKGANRAYEGETSRYRPLLSVYQHRTAGLLDMPPSMDAIVKPLSQMSGAAASMARLGMDLTKTFMGMASDRITGSAVLPDFMDMQVFRDQLTGDRRAEWADGDAWWPGVKDALWSLFPRMYANTINFKQFRDAANPLATCYQAITAARMPVKALKQGGFLGPQNMMLGQIDGGFTIDIHHLAGLPIIETLGLEVSQERESDGSLVSTLTPVAPLWMKVDMTYGLANTLIWRGREGDWQEGEELARARMEANRLRQQSEPDDMDQGGDPRSADMDAVPNDPDEIDLTEDFDDSTGFSYIRAMNFFNTARGASEAVGGAFSAPDASVRVLPLKADGATLRQFVRDYLRVDKEMRFEAWGDYVYLVISDFKQMNSEMSAIAKRRAREMSLLVPVKCYSWFDDGAYSERRDAKGRLADYNARNERGTEHLLTTGFVNAFTFVDDVETAITANEVFGVPSMGSTISASENDWLTHDFGIGRERRDILKMTAQVLPELMAGARAVDRTLIDLTSFHHYHERVQETQDETVSRWVQVLADDLEHKQTEYSGEQNGYNGIQLAQGFALKILGGDLPINQFSLKQFRDSRDTTNACYQGLILRRHRIQKLDDFREIDGPLHVSITDYPTQPITQILGLVPKFSYPGRDRLVRVFESTRPFSINADLTRGSGVTLFERLGNSGWKRVDVTEQMFGWRALSEDEIAALVDKADEVTPLELSYERRMPGSDTVVERRHKEVKPRFLRLWYHNRVRTGQVRNVMVRNRRQPDAISVLSDPASLSKFDPASGVSLAAWNSQMKHAETGHRQALVAAEMEHFSPATVVDRILSRHWGRSDIESMPRFTKPDYCVPVNCLPEMYAAKLFPEAERQHGFWPHSQAFFQHEFARRKSEANAFRTELKSTIQLIAYGYPAALVEAETGKQNQDWDFREYVEFVAKTLNRYLDDVQLELFGGDMTKARSLKIDEDVKWEDIERATEEVVLKFFDIHLPAAFKMSSGSRTNPLDELMSEASGLIDAQDWRAVATALRAVGEKVGETLRNLEDGREFITRHLQPFVRRAEENAREMDQIETALQDKASSVHSELQDPHLRLRERLSALLLGDGPMPPSGTQTRSATRAAG